MRPNFYSTALDCDIMAKKSAPYKKGLDQTIAVLFEITDAVSRTRNLNELYGVIHNALKTIFPADHFYIALCDGAGFSFSYGQGPEKNLPPDPVLVCQVVSSGQARIFSRDDLRSMNPNPSGRVPEGWMGAPLKIRERVIGAMAVQDYGNDAPYTAADLNLFNSVAQHVALAIERKESEGRYSDQSELLEKILEASPIGIALVQNRVFKWVNSEMVRMFGYQDKSEFQDQSVKMIYVAEEDFEFAGRTIYQGLSASGRVDYDMDLIRSDNTLFPVHVRLNTTDSEDPMAWTIATFTDIADRRAAEKETFERERLQGVLEMAGAVCHEINQPLQAIIGNAELLEMDPDSALATSSLDSIKSQASRLGKITSSLANITRYKTLDYPGKTKIVDIWGAGAPRS